MANCVPRVPKGVVAVEAAAAAEPKRQSVLHCPCHRNTSFGLQSYVLLFQAIDDVVNALAPVNHCTNRLPRGQKTS